LLGPPADRTTREEPALVSLELSEAPSEQSIGRADCKAGQAMGLHVCVGLNEGLS